MTRRERLDTIVKVIAENEVSTQTELQKLLAMRGCNVGQATLSRDIKALHLRKTVSDNDVYCYFVGRPHEIQYNNIFAQSVISMEIAMNLVVIKCHSGMAPAACKILDDLELEEVVGTIAGDDTVFVATKSEDYAKNLMSTLTWLKTRH